MSKKKSRIKTRDPLMVRLINGVTKGGAHKDRKKEEDKNAARSSVDLAAVCPECGIELLDNELVFGLCTDCQNDEW